MPRFLSIIFMTLLLSAACRSNAPTPDPNLKLISPSQPPPSPQPPTHSGWTSYTNANNVQAMAFDLDGHLWTGGDGGVVKLDPATGDDTQYSADDGLAPAPVSSISLAPDGSLWFGTHIGVSHFAYSGEGEGQG